jgi:hypothetical protein
MKKYVMGSLLILSLITPPLLAAGPTARREAYDAMIGAVRARTETLTNARLVADRNAAITRVLKSDEANLPARLNLGVRDIATLASRQNGGKEYLERILAINEIAKLETTTAVERANLQIVAKALGELLQAPPIDLANQTQINLLKTNTNLSEALIRDLAADFTLIAQKMSREFVDVYLKRSPEENADLTALYTSVANAPTGRNLEAMVNSLKRIAKAKYPIMTEEEALRELIKEIKQCKQE